MHGALTKPSQAMVILACLACVRFHDDSTIPPALSFRHVLLPTPANGLCFWSCLWLATVATEAEVLGWHLRSRNAQGFASVEDSKWELQVVKDWACKLCLLDATRSRVMKGQSAEDGDIAP